MRLARKFPHYFFAVCSILIFCCLTGYGYWLSKRIQQQESRLNVFLSVSSTPLINTKASNWRRDPLDDLYGLQTYRIDQATLYKRTGTSTETVLVQDVRQAGMDIDISRSKRFDTPLAYHPELFVETGTTGPFDYYEGGQIYFFDEGRRDFKKLKIKFKKAYNLGVSFFGEGVFGCGRPDKDGEVRQLTYVDFFSETEVSFGELPKNLTYSSGSSDEFCPVIAEWIPVHESPSDPVFNLYPTDVKIEEDVIRLPTARKYLNTYDFFDKYFY